MQATEHEWVAPEPASKWRRRTIVLSVFTALTLFYTGVSYLLVAVLAGERFSTRNILIWNATQFYLWAALAPAVIGLTQRHPLERSAWPRVLFFHLGASLVFSAAQVAVSLSLYWFLAWPESKELLPS